MSILDVQHQPRAHRVIQRAMASHRMPHAYLFTGPEGVGREMMAVRLAQMLLCESPVQVDSSEPGSVDPADMGTAAAPDTGFTEAGSDKKKTNRAPNPATRSPLPESLTPRPSPLTPRPSPLAPRPSSLSLDACGECDDCRLVKAGTHPDLAVIYRQLNREHPDSTIRKQKALSLSVDVIRHFLIDRVNRRPLRGRAKIFIVREAERLSDTAQNSLLKTLEEPPPDTFLVLITSALDRMLPTTKSRCQPVLFQPLPTEFVGERLRSMRPEVAEAELQFAARHSAGSLGGALQLLEDGLFSLKQPWGEHLATLTRPARGFAPHLLAQPFVADAKTIGKQAAERDPDMSDTDATRVGLQALLAALAGFYLDAQRRANQAPVDIINVDQTAAIDALAGSLSPRQLVAALQQIAQADNVIGRNANLELTIETMFIGLAAIAQGRPVRRIA